MSAKRGQGRVYRPKYKDRHGEIKQSSIWWIRYSVRGQRIYESAKSDVMENATQLLAKRLSSKGRVVPQHELNRVMYSELEDLLRRDYRMKERRSTDRMELSLRYLRSHFDGWRIVDIGAGSIDVYVEMRQKAGAAAATINRELSALRRAMKLAERVGKARDLPPFELLPEKNVRKGWWTDREVAAVLEHLPEYLRPLILVAYFTGWRRGELLSRRWRHVDLDAGWLELDVGESKDADEVGDGRNFPLYPQLREVLEVQLERRQEVERRTGRIVTALFFKDDGSPVATYKRAWTKARKAAQLEHRTFHDFRRVGARNLTRSGVPKQQAKKLTGHKTDSIFERYSISDAEMMEEAGAKLSANLAERKDAPSAALIGRGGKTRVKTEGLNAASV